jgi:hypothetical protein
VFIKAQVNSNIGNQVVFDPQPNDNWFHQMVHYWMLGHIILQTCEAHFVDSNVSYTLKNKQQIRRRSNLKYMLVIYWCHGVCKIIIVDDDNPIHVGCIIGKLHMIFSLGYMFLSIYERQ